MGSDVGLHVGKNFLDSFPDRVHVSALIPLLNQNKRLGEKTGKGFYQVRTGHGEAEDNQSRLEGNCQLRVPAHSHPWPPIRHYRSPAV